ncbi:restriction endonuclease subunit S [bacterium]|nr:restriction endonuclease subunit S [bacterium]
MSVTTSSKWNEVTFADIIEDSAFGPRFSGDAYADDGNISTLRTTDISEDGRISYTTMPRAKLDEAKFAKHFLKAGDLVITRSGRIGTAAIFSDYSGLVLPGAFLIRFRLRECADPNFFRYWFNSRAGQQRLLSVARGAAQQNINITNVAKLSVPLPPINTQRYIAFVLSRYDNLIENNRRRIKLLEQAARLLYKEWFVHLRFPGHEHVKTKNGVPVGWEKKPLGANAPLKYGKALKEDDRIPGKYPVYGSSGVVGTHEKALVAGPAIIIGRKGNVGSVYWSIEDFHPIDTVYYIEKENSSLLLYYTLFHTPFISTDVAVPGLNRDFAHSRKLLIPNKTLRRLFEDIAMPIHEQIDCLQKYNAALSSARDLLLPRLMNGEIAV